MAQPLIELFRKHFGEDPLEIAALPPSGSHRRYFRLKGNSASAIGVFHKDLKENEAFLGFSKHFRKIRLNVPEVYRVSEDKFYYLIEDLGNSMLIDYVTKYRNDDRFKEIVLPMYKDVLEQLLKFQFEGHTGLDYSLSVPREKFDKQSVLWDLNHFKYFFLKICGIPFDEQKLEDDFHLFSEKIALIPSDYFMFRDFQSRNIMTKDNKCYFIDYQGGRKGALQYDLASLLFESKTGLSEDLREELLNFYFEKLLAYQKTDRERFIEEFYLFVLVRILQAMGAYGLRGWVEKKALFLQSIPHAVQNLKWLIDSGKIPEEFPELRRIINEIIKNPGFRYSIPSAQGKLRVEVVSFSYKKSLPDDLSGNGGGFIFDCRAINNPGRYKDYQSFTGEDAVVEEFLESKSEMPGFLKNVFRLIDQSVENYISCGFANLQISFGCTGGKHRSVYAARKTAEHLKQKYDVVVDIVHREQVK